MLFSSLAKPPRAIKASRAVCTIRILIVGAGLLSLRPGSVSGQEESPDLKRGRKIYAETCASCHGAKGEGVKDGYEEPLTGDASLGELTKRITDTMPEGEEDTCIGEDAAAVARFIHFAFYSEAARIRNRPPRVSLARLTASQLQQSLADLYHRQSGTPWFTADRGVKGQYFTGRGMRRKNRKIERVDGGIDFDFADKGPGAGIDPKEYTAYWSGSLLVEESGRYEIIVRSTCAFDLDLGQHDRQFIDNRVQSGDRTEFRKSIYLTAGRAYPFDLEFIQRKRKTKQPPARISVSWVPPHGRESIIPRRNLLTVMHPSTFALQTKLPPDDRSYGYDRGIGIDQQWDASTTAAAVEFADILIDEQWPQWQRRHRKDSNENRAQLRVFLAEIVETAFRGSLTDELQALYIDKQVDVTEDDQEAIKRVVLGALKSPRFLYPLVDSKQSRSQRVANRLALTLFDSLPADDRMRKAVQQNKLETEPQIRAMADSMTFDFRTRAKTRQMIHEWLNLSRFEEIAKDGELYPGFDDAVVADLRLSLNAFVDEVLWSDANYRELFLADWTMTTPKLVEFYGDTWQPAEEGAAGLVRSVADSERRFGLLTHPYLLSGLSYHDTTSPIHRGVFLVRYMLGRALRPPNEAFTPFSADLHPNLTTRERVALQTSPENCQGCHVKINGLGFTLENFDAVGRYRQKERGKSIDATGRYLTRTDEEVTFESVRQLAEFLADSDDAHRAFVARAFQHFVKQPVAAYGPDTLDKLLSKFRTNNCNIRLLLVDIAVVAANIESESVVD